MPDEQGAGARDARPGQVQELDRTLSALERISRALTVTTEGVHVLLQTIVATVAEVFDCPFVFLVVRSGAGELCAMYPPPETLPESGRPIPGAWCITEQTLLDGGPMQVSCLASEGCPCLLPQNLITVPMSRGGLLEGSISLNTSGDSELDEYNSQVLQVLANQATVAVQNARLYEESQQLRRRAEELYSDAEAQRQVAERKRRELEIARDELDAMEREQIISDERERIARELHDDVAQILAAIGLNVEWCRQQLPPEELVQERLSCLKQLARDGLYQIRHALLGLSPTTVTELGLTEALERLVDDFQRISRLPATIEVRGDRRPSRDGDANAIYHICQEALYNVFKHAQATHVHVELAFEPDAVRVTVTDDGVGFAPAAEGAGAAAAAGTAEGTADGAQAVSFGLRNMKARADELGGRLTIEPDADRGTRVSVLIPG